MAKIYVTYQDPSPTYMPIREMGVLVVALYGVLGLFIVGIGIVTLFNGVRMFFISKKYAALIQLSNGSNHKVILTKEELEGFKKALENKEGGMLKLGKTYINITNIDAFTYDDLTEAHMKQIKG